MDQPGDDGRVLDGVDAAVNALRAEQIEGLADEFWGTFLAGMGDNRLAEGAATHEQALELARRMAFFRGVEAEAGDMRQIRLGLGQSGKAIFFR